MAYWMSGFGRLDDQGQITCRWPQEWPQAPKHVISVQAWYKGGAGEAQLLPVRYVDGSGVILGFGPPDAYYKVYVCLADQPDIFWDGGFPELLNYFSKDRP
jgi:hypothetical protein